MAIQDEPWFEALSGPAEEAALYMEARLDELSARIESMGVVSNTSNQAFAEMIAAITVKAATITDPDELAALFNSVTASLTTSGQAG